MTGTFKLLSALLISLLFISCSPRGGLFGKKSPHDQYAKKLTDAGLDKTSLGVSWFTAAVNALNRPLAINIPFKEVGYFAGETPKAAGYSFPVKKGEVLVTQIQIHPAGSANLFIDLWHKSGNDDPKYIASSDTSTLVLRQEIDEDGNYILRLQPELLRGIQYTLTITTEPSLAFPVRSHDQPRTSSFWGAARDGGTRSHEGIDIFAKRGTPAIAGAGGRVTRVNENNLGGKVVFMRPAGKNYSLYYAHLDSQIVKEGDRVETGDTIGFIGNTGNARTTPPHLHFGIYSARGAVDPFPFVNANRPQPKEVTVLLRELNSIARTTNSTGLLTSLIDKKAAMRLSPHTLVRIVGATDGWYKISTPDGDEGYADRNSISPTVYRNATIQSSRPLFDRPDSLSAIITQIQPSSEVEILGMYNGFQYVKKGNVAGWMVVDR